MKNNPKDPIAVIGIGCRFPGGANNHKAFWRLLTQGKDAITDVPKDRWDSRRFYDPNPDKPSKTYVNQAGFLKEKIYDFDPLFFGISPREAESMDPQQRLLLEVTWEAFEDAGLTLEELSGSSTGVFIGGFALDNLVTRFTESNRELADTHTGTSCSMTLLSNRISYTFNLHGPSISLDTACSSSLVATHYACQSLWNGECNVALAGGVNLILGPEYSVVLSKGRFLSDHGRCMAFDQRAAGYSRGEGAGVVILKTLSSALRDNDSVYALLRMTGINQDGHTPGISMPNADAQESLIRGVYQRANVPPEDIGYVEAHGTGTQAGDPKEIHALNSVISTNRTKDQKCLVGSVKTNIGHLEAGAGIAGLIKATLCLNHEKIPPNLHFEQPNPAIPFDEMCLRVPTQLENWPKDNGIRFAGVNSFGYGGTNAHVLLQQAPLRDDPEPIEPWDKPYLVPLSTRSEPALRDLAGKYAFFLASQSGTRTMPDFLHTLIRRRSHHSHRLTLIANTQEELKEKLQLFSSGDYIEHQSMGIAQTNEEPRLVFIYTGMGPQWWAMGRELIAKEPLFLATVKKCDDIFQREAGWSVYEALMQDESSSQITRTDIAQPANFVIQIALTALWKNRGIKPDVVIGHSVGEVAAAYVCGALSLKDAIKVSVHRSQLQATTTGKGAMLATGLAKSDALELIRNYEQIAIGAINSPSSTTLSGEFTQLKHIAAVLQKQDIFNRFLDVDVAYHSPQMETIKQELLSDLATINPQSARYPLYSTVTGNRIESNMLNADYWWRNVRESVCFCDGIQSLIEEGFVNFLEIGPHPVLAHSVKEIATELNTKVNLISSLNRKFPEQIQMLESLGELYTLGFPVDWKSVIPKNGQFISLPTYPWQKEYYWNESEDFAQYRFGHPGYVFLNNKQHSPHPTWTVELNEQFFPFLEDHKVNDEIVFPGMAFVDAGLTVHKTCVNSKVCVLSEVKLHNMLFIEPHRVQVLSVDYNELTKQFSIYSRYKEDGAEWKYHADGKLIDGSYSRKHQSIDIGLLKERINQEVNTTQMYADLKTRGLSYGPTFQCAKQLWTSENEILLHIELMSENGNQQKNHLLYPPIPDSALHSILTIVPGHAPYVPISIDKVLFYQPLPDDCWCHGMVTKRDSNSLIVNYYFYDIHRTLLSELRDVLHQEMLSVSNQKDDFLQTSLYEPKWVTYKANFKELRQEIKDCLIFAHESPILCDIQTMLKQKGIVYTNIFNGDGFQKTKPEHFIIDGSSASDFEQLLRRFKNNNFSHIFYLWPLAQDLPSDLNKMVATCSQLTYLIQATTALIERDIELVIIMQNSQLVTEKDTEINLNLSPIWGLGQLIQNEHPNIHCRLIDIGGNQSITQYTDWFHYLAFDSSSDLAFRIGNIFSKKLTRFRPEERESIINKKSILTEEPVYLDILRKGQLDSFVYRKTERQEPNPNEVEIKVQYSALNFKDLLKAYGTISPEIIADTYYGSSIGMEITGVVTAVGTNVSNFSIGDEVVAAAIGAFRSYVTVSTKFVLHKPLNVGSDEFFIHANFMAAYYSLLNIGDIKSGEKILIHSAAGGLGLAAIQIAQWKCAEIFATAGTSEKRDYLRSLGIKNVMDSRSLDFVGQIKSSTEGQGIDIVLNTLSGEALKQSFELLAPHGRFIEVGKKDISDNSSLPMATFNKNIMFSAIDMDRISVDKPEILPPILNRIKEGFETGIFSPLPTTVFAANEISEAFRHMAQAKHIGKIIVKYDDETVDVISEFSEQSVYKSDGSYLITGGTSGFGLELAKWLGDKGVGKLVLVSRSGATTEEAKQVVASLKEKGIVVETPQVDISDFQETRKLIDSLKVSAIKLKGIFHGAMVLDDGFIRHMDILRYTTVMTPKISGALNLYRCFESDNLDFFVMFSSIASLIGNRGQANYIAANSFLDEFAHALRLNGIPAMTINWGVLAETGIAARNSEISTFLEKEGIFGLTNKNALSSLDKLIAFNKPQVGVFNVDWHTWEKADPHRKYLSRFLDLTRNASKKDDINSKAIQLAETLANMPSKERLKHIESILQETAAKILKLTPNKININQDIGTLGIDSLMFMELALTAQSIFGVTITTMELMKEPIIADFSKTVLNKIFVLYETVE